MPLDLDVADRAAGVLAGLACGDALGAPYEFAPPLAPGAPVGMVGGGSFGWAPGEWTDDTSMAVVVLDGVERAVAAGEPLTGHLDVLAAGWAAWARDAPDVGAQTRAVLAAAEQAGSVTGEGLRTAASAHHARTGRSGGNGSLMRTAPVALAGLATFPDTLAWTARQVSELTHHDPEAGDACVLWCEAIRRAVLRGELDVRSGLALLPPERRDVWAARLDDAESRDPWTFPRNGWVVEALQAAWSAIHRTPVPSASPQQHLVDALERAVRGGYDTDTVAAIAGSLLGARWGLSAVPAPWAAVVHGWPGLRLGDLAQRGRAVAEAVVADAELLRAQVAWAGGFDGYAAVGDGPGELGRVVGPLAERLRTDGRVPDDCPLDVLRAWAFFLVRADRHGGGWSLAPGGSAVPELRAVLAAVAVHPDRGPDVPAPPL